MPDIIVKQQPTTSLTVQSNSTQLLIRQAAANNITVSTTGNSYFLPAATNSTLGGIIVGDNLSINANGVLSAQAGGVTSFNNRTGNVSLTANDVSGLAFPLSSNLTVTSGEKRIRGVISNLYYGNGTYYPRDIYGITRNGTESNITYEYYMGVGYNGTLNPGAISTTGAAGIAVGITSVNPNSTNDLYQIQQRDLTINSFGSYLQYTSRSDVPPFTAGNIAYSQLGALQNYVTLQRYRSVGGTFELTEITVYDGFITIRGDLKAAQVKEITDQSTYLTKYAADRLYQPLTRLN